MIRLVGGPLDGQKRLGQPTGFQFQAVSSIRGQWWLCTYKWTHISPKGRDGVATFDRMKRWKRT